MQAAFAKSRGRARSTALRQLAQVGLQAVAAGADLRTFAVRLCTGAGDSATMAVQLPEGAELTQSVQKLQASMATAPGMIFLQLVSLGWERSCATATPVAVTAAVNGAILANTAAPFVPTASLPDTTGSSSSAQAEAPAAPQEAPRQGGSVLQEDHGVGGQLLKEFGF